MSQCHYPRVLTVTVVLAAAVFAGGCDRKPSMPPTPSANGAPSTTVSRNTTTPDSYPAGIVPANSGTKVDAAGAGSKADSNKGPADGSTAIGGVTGNSGTGASGAPPQGGTPAPTAGDGAASPKQ